MIVNDHIAALQFSYFHNPDLGIRNTTPLRDIGFIDLINLYNSDEVKNQTKKIQSCSNPDEKMTLKKALPMVTCNATFSEGRTLDKVKYHNDHLLVIDIDGLSSEEEARRLQSHFSLFECCALSAVSAKQRGVKAMILTVDEIKHRNGDESNYRYYFLKHNAALINKALRLHSSLTLDAAQFNVTQPFFLAHDEQMYINCNAIPLHFSFVPFIKNTKPTTQYTDPVNVPINARNRVEFYLKKTAENICDELRHVGTIGIPRHPQIAKVKNVAQITHYAPQITDELRGCLLNAVCDMYGGVEAAEDQNAITSFETAWNAGACIKAKNDKIDEIINDTNTTTK